MTIKITFNNKINSSLQIGDHIYYVQKSIGQIILDVNNSNYIGKVSDIEKNDIYVDGNINAGDSIWTNPTDYFALFAKDVRVNESSLKGYYADVEFTNSSNELIELFAISSEIVPSSK